MHARNAGFKSIETGLPSGWLSVFGTGKNGYQPFRSGISFGSQPLHFALNIVFDTANGYRVGVDDNIARTLVSVVRKAYTAAVHDRAFFNFPDERSVDVPISDGFRLHSPYAATKSRSGASAKGALQRLSGLA